MTWGGGHIFAWTRNHLGFNSQRECSTNTEKTPKTTQASPAEPAQFKIISQAHEAPSSSRNALMMEVVLSRSCDSETSFVSELDKDDEQAVHGVGTADRAAATSTRPTCSSNAELRIAARRKSSSLEHSNLLEDLLLQRARAQSAPDDCACSRDIDAVSMHDDATYQVEDIFDSIERNSRVQERRSSRRPSRLVIGSP